LSTIASTDFDRNGVVNVQDLLVVIGHWTG